MQRKLLTLFGHQRIALTIISVIATTIRMIIGKNYALRSGASLLFFYPLTALALSGLARLWLRKYWQWKATQTNVEEPAATDQ
ncbi:MAG: hypothetical protein ABI700_00945 [Chloroflexota bacterium]